MKYYHAPLKRNTLTQSLGPGDKIIYTTMGTFKIRKNGIQQIVIDVGSANEERIRVTPIAPVIHY